MCVVGGSRKFDFQVTIPINFVYNLWYFRKFYDKLFDCSLHTSYVSYLLCILKYLNLFELSYYETTVHKFGFFISDLTSTIDKN